MCFGVLMKRFNVFGPRKTVSKSKGYLETAIERPTYSATLTLVHGIASLLTHFILEIPKGVLAKSADPDQMPHNVASDLGLHYFASCSAIFQQKFSINIT